MKSHIFYACIDQPNRPRDYTLVLPAGSMTPIFVRATTVAGDVCDALDLAKPRKGEIVLNSIEAPNQ